MEQRFNKPIENSNLAEIQYLKFGHDFNQDLEKCNFKKLEYLEFKFLNKSKDILYIDFINKKCKIKLDNINKKYMKYINSAYYIIYCFNI